MPLFAVEADLCQIVLALGQRLFDESLPPEEKEQISKAINLIQEARESLKQIL